MEFGIMTIAESQFTFLMLTGFKIIDVHDTPYNHALLNGAKKCRLLINTVALFVLFSWEGGGGVIGFIWKNIWIYWHIWLLIYLLFYLTVLALLLTVVLSFLFIMTGMYGELEQIGVTFSLLISIQVYYNIHHIKMIFIQVAKF